MKPWRRFSNELLACGYWWRFHRVLTAQWWARHGINLSGNPTLWPGPGWLIQGNIRGCILNTRWRHTRGLDAAGREGGKDFEERKNLRRVWTHGSILPPRGSIVPFFPHFVPFYLQRCDPVQRTDSLPFFAFHRAELFYRSAITISLVRCVERKKRRGTATNAQSNYTLMPV